MADPAPPKVDDVAAVITTCTTNLAALDHNYKLLCDELTPEPTERRRAAILEDLDTVTTTTGITYTILPVVHGIDPTKVCSDHG